MLEVLGLALLFQMSHYLLILSPEPSPESGPTAGLGTAEFQRPGA